LAVTKRIELFDKLAPWPRHAVPSNVWIGVTCEDQEHFDRRYPHLHDIAAIKFISYEPALGPLKLGNTRPDWIICGGESGPGARQMDPQWARNLRDECAAIAVPFFMKQMTGKKPIPPNLLVRQFPTSIEWAPIGKWGNCNCGSQLKAGRDFQRHRPRSSPKVPRLPLDPALGIKVLTFSTKAKKRGH